MKNIEPIVSVCIFTYNHEKYIEQCIESVLMQRTSFPYEIIIGEDYSTDKTRVICKNYASNYENIKLLDRGGNLKLSKNYLDTLQQAKGKYTAILDGDDYWINPLKLQKQVDLLEAKKNINICFHQVIKINEINNNKISLFVNEIKEMYNLEDITNDWIMATGSIMFRTSYLTYPSFLKHTINFDLAIQMLLLSDHSCAGYINEIMSIYRINIGSNTANPEYDLINTCRRQKLLFEEFNEYTNGEYSQLINLKIKHLIYKSDQYGQVSIKKKLKKLGKKLFNILGYKIQKTTLNETF